MYRQGPELSNKTCQSYVTHQQGRSVTGIRPNLIVLLGRFVLSFLWFMPHLTTTILELLTFNNIFCRWYLLYQIIYLSALVWSVSLNVPFSLISHSCYQVTIKVSFRQANSLCCWTAYSVLHGLKYLHLTSCLVFCPAVINYIWFREITGECEFQSFRTHDLK